MMSGDVFALHGIAAEIGMANLVDNSDVLIRFVGTIFPSAHLPSFFRTSMSRRGGPKARVGREFGEKITKFQLRP
jgi:hypothetical protein